VTGFLKRRVVPFLPIVLLLALTSVGLANALQSEEEEGPDLGPQLADYNDDVTSYLVGAAEYRAAPNVPISTDEDGDTVLEFAVTGCAEGSPITIELVPRLLPEAEAEANEALADDDPAKVAQEPVPVVEEAEALADGSAYEITIPKNFPLGFTRIRTTCVDADGNELISDTVIDLVLKADFDAAQEGAEEPEELSTTIEGKPVTAPVEPAADATEEADG
jgi:hypothetical protein